MRILLVEDDEILIALLRQSLTSQHYAIDTTTDGQMGWEYAQSVAYDLILMDVGLPKLDGITLCQRLRSAGCTTPILMMTAKEATGDRIRGLDAGADDYLIKPLNLAELQARVRALLRRGEVDPTSILQVGDLRLDPRNCQVSYGNKPIALTPKEYSLLELFLRNPSRVFSRGQIVEHLWTFDDPPLEESVKAHIKGLRQRLKAAGAVDWIENVYGLGYRLKEGLGNRENYGNNAVSSPTPSVAPPAQQQFDHAKEALWQQSQGLMQQRLTVLQEMAAAVQAGVLPADLQQSAAQAAHKLAGVLGMFDRDAGSELARELEELLTAAPLRSHQHPRLMEVVQQLSTVLAAPFSAPSLPVPLAADARCIRVLVIDDDPVFLAALPPMLQPWGIHLTVLDDPLRFWKVLPTVAPDLLMLDVEMPKVSGIGLCQAVRAHAAWQSLPILVVTAHRDRDTIQQVFAAGADDYITKPIVGAELFTRITHRLERNRLLQTLANQDPLTKLPNQPQSSRELEQLLQTAGHQPVYLMVLSLPELLQINRHQGHATGNQVLQRWGQILQSTFSSPSEKNAVKLGYWGNGEFVVGLTASQLGDDADAIDRRFANLSRMLRQQIFEAPDGRRFQVEFGIGIAQYPAEGTTLQALYQTASVRSHSAD
ncbi:MAG TPA: response regulator [Coleofasciculaceae cyanobacterium]